MSELERTEKYEEKTKKIEDKYERKADDLEIKLETKKQKKLLKAKRKFGIISQEEYESIIKVFKAKVDSVIGKSKPSKIPLPKYSLGEELVSAISHGIGVLFGIVALVLCILMSVEHGDVYAVISSSLFGSSIIIMYAVSTIYHSLTPCKGKRVFRVLDHCCIFLLIAGTYTPYTLVALRGATGWVLFGLVWGISILGIVFNAINVEKFKVFSMISYIAVGWVIIFKIGDLLKAVPKEGVMLVLAGGIVYSIGAIVYGIGSKVKYVHSVWHFFVLAGTVLQFLSIYLYVI